RQWFLSSYFCPFSLSPDRFRLGALNVGSGRPTAVMCSSRIARAFQNVGFPILPATTPATTPRPRRRLRDYLRRPSDPYPAVFRRERPTLVTPRDFDLSPYFELVKLNGLE